MTLPIAFSAVLHAGIVALLIQQTGPTQVSMPPMYRVDLVAAPPGPPAVGVVDATPPPDAPPPAPPKAAAAKAVKAPPIKAKPAKAVKMATANVAKAAPKSAPAPKAAGGEEGGKGADVVGAHIEGVEFPFPEYLANIERQIALNFSQGRNGGALRCEVFFMIRRDGSVSGFRFLTRSGSLVFDLEAQGAVEAAAKRFGPLPTPFAEDVLPVVFSFDPSKLK